MQIIKEILLSLHSNLPDSRSSNGNYVACSRSRTVPLPEAFKAKGAVLPLPEAFKAKGAVFYSLLVLVTVYIGNNHESFLFFSHTKTT